MPTGVVAVGALTPVSYSLDNGYTWTAGSGVAFTTGYTVAYNGSLWVAGGQGSPGSLQNVATSTDGINWTPRTTPPFAFRSIVWNGSYWLAGGAGSVAKSFDGINWTLYTAFSGKLCTCLAWGNGKWVAGTYVGGTAAYTSPDGQTWTAIVQLQTSPTSIAAGLDILWDGTQFLMAVQANFGDTQNTTYTSPDGITWTGATPISINPATNLGYVVGFNGSSYIRQSSDTVNRAQISNDGNTWSYINDPVAQAGFSGSIYFGFKQLIWTGTEWIFAKSTNPILHSPDGLTWSQSTPLGAPFALEVGMIIPPTPPQINFPHMIQNIKLPNGPKDVVCQCRPIAPYRNIPEPAVTPSNPGQRLDCIARGALPYANYGTAYKRYSPYEKTTYTVGYNRLPGSRIAETWPPPSNK